MNILFPILMISLIVAVGFLIAFFWAIRSGQYEDDYTPSIRILFDDKEWNESSKVNSTEE